jgi:hypothetical protein
MSTTRSYWTKRLGVGTLALLGLGAVAAQPFPAQARAQFDINLPTYVAPPPYYAYARPASYSSTSAVAGAVGFGGGHWQ